MTYNEQARIRDIISLYGSEFDIVILDGGSGDATLDIVQQHGGTAYERIGDNIGENHFAHYVNNLTQSGYCFYMMCDEYIELSELRKIERLLAEGECQIFGRRIDWFYGVQARKPTCLLPKGFRRGQAHYSEANFHDTLKYVDSSKVKLIVDVHHLHVFSMKDDYGKFGHYIYHEVKQLRSTAMPTRAAFVRFLKLVRALQLNVVRFPNRLWLLCFLMAQFFATTFLFLMSYIEQRGLMTKDEQIRKYSLKYGKE